MRTRPLPSFAAVLLVSTLAPAAGCTSGPGTPDDFQAALEDARSGTESSTGGEGASNDATQSEQSADDDAPDRTPGRVITGKASYYADSLAGNTTASGDVYDPDDLTAAARDIPFGTRVRVTRIDNDKSVVVRINDRGPFGDSDRVIDLSRAAAEKLGMIRAGVVNVRVEVLD